MGKLPSLFVTPSLDCRERVSSFDLRCAVQLLKFVVCPISRASPDRSCDVTVCLCVRSGEQLVFVGSSCSTGPGACRDLSRLRVPEMEREVAGQSQSQGWGRSRRQKS